MNRVRSATMDRTALRMWFAAGAMALLVASTGCQSPPSPGPISQDEVIQTITRGTVPLRLAVLPPSMEQDPLDPEDDERAAIQYTAEGRRDKLVEELGEVGPFQRVMPIDAEQIASYQQPDFNPAELPADLYLEVRLKRYLMVDEGHNGTFYFPNLLFMALIIPPFSWPFSFYVADETYSGTISAEVLVVSMYSNLTVMRRLQYKNLTYEADINEFDDDPWESVSDLIEEQAWRVFTRELVADLHDKLVAASQADDWASTLGKIERERQWEALQRKEAEAVQYAYILGVGDYFDDDLPDLDFAENDAKAVRDFLRGRPGVDLKPYIGRSAGSDSSTEFDSGALKTLREVTEKATEKDSILLYLIGKGAVIRSEAGASSYFLLYDSNLDPAKIAETSLPLERLYSLLEQTRARQITVLLDLRDIEYREASQTGGAGGAEGDGVSGFYEQILPQGGGRVLLASAQPGQRAHESATVGAGGFTYYLLEGAGGAADADGDGVVTVGETREYLAPRLDKLARLLGYRQEPLLLGSSPESPVLPR